MKARLPDPVPSGRTRGTVPSTVMRPPRDSCARAHFCRSRCALCRLEPPPGTADHLHPQAGMARRVGPRIQQFIDELTAALAQEADEPVARRIRYLLGLLDAAAEEADELDRLLARDLRHARTVRSG